MKPEHIRNITINAAVITVSSSRTPDTDTSGQIAITELTRAGIAVDHYVIVPDVIVPIREELYAALKTCNCVVVNGGTGLTQDDCTIEAILPLLDKKIDGFGELFRHMSFEEIGTSAMLTRALAGIIEGKVVFCIPGSNAAVKLATSRIIVPEIIHILSHAGT
jgi:molybdopterin adenylyltransferase